MLVLPPLRRLLLVGGLLALSLVCAAPAVTADDPRGDWSWPLQPAPAVLATFDPPEHPYGPGHRGVDLAGSPGQPVLAVEGGVVSFAGQVAGRGVVVVDHGRLRSTYEPVLPAVRQGRRVPAGQVVGTLTTIGSHCLPATCLHLGARDGETYVDPLELLPPLGPVRLLPLDGLPVLPADWFRPVLR